MNYSDSEYLSQFFSLNLKINIHFVDILGAVLGGGEHSLLLLHEVNPELKVQVLLLEAVELIVILPHGEVGGALGQAARAVGDAAVHLPGERVLGGGGADVGVSRDKPDLALGERRRRRNHRGMEEADIGQGEAGVSHGHLMV